jgi:uncharacterized membrane protein
MPDADPASPDHVETAVRSIAQIHTAHGKSASPGQRALNRAAAFVSRPSFLTALLLLIAFWIIANLCLPSIGMHDVDPPPFQWLQGVMSLVSLCLVVLLVGAQRHENELTQKRDLIELELAMVGEQKMGKVIQLLEELRRDMPGVHDRVDEQAIEMSRSPDHRQVLNTLVEFEERAAD